MINSNLYFLPTPQYATYPPYHQGLYLEDYFINLLYTRQDASKSECKFIPISWTSYYNNGMPMDILQNALDSLPRNLQYYTVSQHDDAPAQRLPPNTKVFSAGGNYSGPNCIPIPLICSPITKPESVEKDIFCSFVGSSTHGIRNDIYNTFKDDIEFYFSQGVWDINVTHNKLDNFINITNRSKFALCPRGYGKSSFRLYEVMQLGAVPVYVSDHHYLPWTDELNWSEFCVLISPQDIPNIKTILKNINESSYEKMLTKSKEIYNNYFTLDSVCTNILKRI